MDDIFYGSGTKKSKTSLELEEGQFVAVYCPKYVELPQIGRVLSVDDSNVEVEWWLGTYSASLEDPGSTKVCHCD